MIVFLIIWILASFVILINYVGSEKYYETSDRANLWIEAICFPAFLIMTTIWMLEDYIEKIKERND